MNNPENYAPDLKQKYYLCKNFKEEAPHDIAVRVWSQSFSIDEVTTLKGKKFKLINLPFYYVGVLEEILKKQEVHNFL